MNSSKNKLPFILFFPHLISKILSLILSLSLIFCSLWFMAKEAKSHFHTKPEIQIH